VLPDVGHACINLRVLKSPIGFPLASRISYLTGMAEPWLAVPEKLGAEIVPALPSGERKPTKVHGTVIGPAVVEGRLSRVSERTVVTK